MNANLTLGSAETNCIGGLNVFSRVIIASIFSISGFMAALGNAMVLVAVWRTPNLHTVSNYFISSLALTDLMAGVVLSPLWVWKTVHNIWQNEPPFAVWTEFLTLQSISVTTYNLLTVTLDRYLAITRGMHYATLVTPQRCFVAIGTGWLVSFATPTARAILRKPRDLHILWTTGSALGYFIPWLILTYCYLNIYKVARLQARKIADRHITDKEQAAQFAKNKKAAWTMGIIVGLCYVLWTPACIVASVQIFTSDACLKIEMNATWFWAVGVAFISSATNPWIYAARLREFRAAFKRCGVLFWTSRRLHVQRKLTRSRADTKSTQN